MAKDKDRRYNPWKMGHCPGKRGKAWKMAALFSYPPSLLFSFFFFFYSLPPPPPPTRLFIGFICGNDLLFTAFQHQSLIISLLVDIESKSLRADPTWFRFNRFNYTLIPFIEFFYLPLPLAINFKHLSAEDSVVHHLTWSMKPLNGWIMSVTKWSSAQRPLKRVQRRWIKSNVLS